jgi:hypothetical protein
VLLAANPLDSTENLGTIQGVGLRGIWLDRDALTGIEESLEKVFAVGAQAAISDTEKQKILAAGVPAMLEAGFPYPAYLLQEIEALPGY